MVWSNSTVCLAGRLSLTHYDVMVSAGVHRLVRSAHFWPGSVTTDSVASHKLRGKVPRHFCEESYRPCTRRLVKDRGMAYRAYWARLRGSSSLVVAWTVFHTVLAALELSTGVDLSLVADVPIA